MLQAPWLRQGSICEHANSDYYYYNKERNVQLMSMTKPVVALNMKINH